MRAWISVGAVVILGLVWLVDGWTSVARLRAGLEPHCAVEIQGENVALDAVATGSYPDPSTTYELSADGAACQIVDGSSISDADNVYVAGPDGETSITAGGVRGGAWMDGPGFAGQWADLWRMLPVALAMGGFLGLCALGLQRWTNG